MPECDNIDIWLAFPDQIREPQLLARYVSLLDHDEQQRWQRIRPSKIRHHYLVAHALVRTTLSRYAAIEPQQWRFSHNHYGRPEIANAGWSGLKFNLSHTDGLVACAVNRKHAIGVDVETCERATQTADIAERFFSADECRDLLARPSVQQHEYFFNYWTLKEAYIKAKGMGLSLPLGQFSFRLRDGESITISFDSCLNDDPQHWQFWLFRPSLKHKLALCVACTDVQSQPILYRTVPLISTATFVCELINHS